MSARRRSTNKEAADQAPKGARLEYLLKVVPLVTGAVSGVLALIPQTSIFGPFDYTAETLPMDTLDGTAQQVVSWGFETARKYAGT